MQESHHRMPDPAFHMKKILILIICLVGFVGVIEVDGQSQKVKIIRIEVDSKMVTSDFQLFIYKDGHKISPIRYDSSFVVPAELGDSPVSVEIIFKGYDLWFSPVYPSKFSTNWIVGVDEKPFDKENLGSEIASDLRLIYFLQFVSDRGDDTRLVVSVKKKKRKESSSKPPKT